MQVYGDAALFEADGDPRNFNFLIGTLPDLRTPTGSWKACPALSSIHRQRFYSRSTPYVATPFTFAFAWLFKYRTSTYAPFNCS